MGLNEGSNDGSACIYRMSDGADGEQEGFLNLLWVCSPRVDECVQECGQEFGRVLIWEFIIGLIDDALFIGVPCDFNSFRIEIESNITSRLC